MREKNCHLQGYILKKEKEYNYTNRLYNDFTNMNYTNEHFHILERFFFTSGNEKGN